MNTYVIYAQVPAPESLGVAARRRGRPATYPFSRMEVGDSFVAESKFGRSLHEELWEIRKLSKSWARRANSKAQFDGVVEDGVLRVWRTK